MADENGSNQNLPVTSKALYREDLIRHATSRDRIGIVLLNGLDSESSSESEDEEGDKVAEGHVLVSWYPKGHEEEIEEAKLEVVDRSLQHGDIVRWADPAKGVMKGNITCIKVKVNIKVIGASHFKVKNIDCSELTPLQKFYQGLSIAFRSWIGDVREVYMKLTLKLKNGARCIIEGEQANMLGDNTDQRDEESPYYCEMFYPGQCVAGPSRLFKDARWINGPRPVLTGSQKVSCVVEEVAVSGLRVHWQRGGFNTNENEAFPTEPSSVLPEDDLQDVFAFDNLKYDGIQIGDKAFYTLKECDVNNPSSKSLSDEQAAYHKEQADHKRSKQSGKGKEVPIDEADDDKFEDNDSTFSEDSADDEDSDHGNVRESRQSTTANAGSRRNEARHQGATATPRGHAARKRRQIRRKKKRYQVPARLVPGERVCVEVESTAKLLTVKWQDGSVQENISSTEVLPVLHVDEFEFFPGDFIIDKTSDSKQNGYGVVQKSDNAQRTCKVKWVGNGEGECVDEVSVYDIGEHPDYNFKLGDIVVRLIDVNDPSIEEGVDIATVPTTGEVLRVDNEGRIHVLWTDQTISSVLPQNVFAVDNEDYSDSENMNATSDEEWETASDVSTDPEQFMEQPLQPHDLDILDDIARRSVSALSSTARDNAEASNEEPMVQNDIADAAESADNMPAEDGRNDAQSSVDASNIPDVKVRPNVNESNSPEVHSTFSIQEEVPSSHKFASQPFQPANQRQFNSAIRKEIAGFKSHLPPGVIVKGFENRLDLCSIMIEGPAGTPYEDGIFIFDVQLPPNYPKAPPAVHYLSQCSGRLNPNLYEDGTVCVSLLGTWKGKGSETWTSKSNLCQLILSLQGLILVEEPYFNEAGYEKHKGSAEGAENSRMYNELVLIKMMESLERLWKNPPETFKDEVKQHLKEHLPRLFRRIYNWLGLYAADDFLEKHKIEKQVEEGSIPKPEFPLLPLSVGFCISLLRSLKNLEKSFKGRTI